jgi:hypothetical protein
MDSRIFRALIFSVPAFFAFCYLLVNDSRADLTGDTESVMPVKIKGRDELHTADVLLEGGIRRLATDSVVTVEEVFGQDPQGTTWGFFGNTLEDANGIGSTGNTVRVQIPAAVTPLGTIYPAVDYTYTITASDVANSNPERAVALNLCTGLNADANFQSAKWQCSVAKDFSLFHINSRLFNEFGTRSSWTLTCSGATVCNPGYTDIKRRGKPTELSRSPNDPRQGILAIAGTVSTVPGGIGDAFYSYLKNTVGSNNFKIDCSPYIAGTCDFKVESVSDEIIFIEYIRCFGGGSGIQFGKFLSQSGTGLTNGLVMSVKSEDEIFTFEPIKKTEDFKNIMASIPGSDFRVDIQSGSDQFIAQFRPSVAIPLLPSGTFTTNDYINIKVSDDLSAGLAQLQCSVFGFKREP